MLPPAHAMPQAVWESAKPMALFVAFEQARQRTATQRSRRFRIG
jgi:hypothetical protein